MNTERKPVITYAGEQQVFRQLQNGLVHGISQEQIEWRRGQGRPSVLVTLDATFEPLSDQWIASENDEAKCSSNLASGKGAVDSKCEDSLKRCASLHTYWMDVTDIESYRQSGREPMLRWLSGLRRCGVVDWLLVVLESGEQRSKTNKLLTRSTASVLDRIKQDAQSKHSERCVSLIDPSRSDARAAGSLHALIARLRQLLMTGLGRTLARFESNIRARQERCGDAEWKLGYHCLLQEELALTYQQMALPVTESLALYDELDKFLCEIITADSLHKKQHILSLFTPQLSHWRGLSLSDSCHDSIRQQIADNRVSFLDFRNYIFGRQCALLQSANFYTELAERTAAMIVSALTQLHWLNIDVHPGGIECWVFCTCMHIVDACNAHESEPTVHMAVLYDLARNQLYSLGELCGLLPVAVGDDGDGDSGPTSQQLHVSVTLSAGADVGGRAGDAGLLSHALSSAENMQRIYLELTELATGTYKHVGRLRTARAVGCQLAEFQLRLGRYAHAASLLSDAAGSCRRDGWQLLASHCVRRLLLCYQLTGEIHRYIQTCATLVDCEQQLFNEGHLECVDLLAEAMTGRMRSLTLSDNSQHLSPTPANSEALCSVVTTAVICASRVEHSERAASNCGVLCASIVCVDLQVENRSSVSICAERCYIELLCDDQLTSTLDDDDDDGGGRGGDRPTPLIDLCVEHRHDKTVSAAALVCRNASTVLRRKNSGPPLTLARGRSSSGGASDRSESASAVDKVYRLLAGEVDGGGGVCLHPGPNLLHLEQTIDTEGEFLASELIIDTQYVHLVVSIPRVRLRVKFVPFSVELIHKENVLVSGIAQQVSLVVTCGSSPLPNGGDLQVFCSSGLNLCLAEESPSSVSHSADCVSDTPHLSLSLPSLSPRQSVVVKLWAFSELSFSESAIDHTVNFSGAEGRVKCLKQVVTFYRPFAITHKLHTADQRKFVQVHVSEARWRPFLMNSASLDVVGDRMSPLSSSSPSSKHAVTLQSLNPNDQMIVSDKNDVSFVWQLAVTTDTVTTDTVTSPAVSDRLKLVFRAQYAPTNDTSVQHVLRKNFIMADFTTLFTISCSVQTCGGVQLCRAGCLCKLVIRVEQLTSFCSQQLQLPTVMYELLADQHLWAICGPSSGVINIDDTPREHVVSVDVMPLVAGSLCVPSVRLSKYITQHRDGASDEEMPRLLPFSAGQVYNLSRRQRVEVVPANSGGGAPRHVPLNCSSGATITPTGVQ